MVYLLSLIALSPLNGVAASRGEETEMQNFSWYKEFYGRSYVEDTAEHELRQSIYTRRLTEIRAHNAQNLPWEMGVNEFTDFTDDELKQMQGYTRWLRPGGASPALGRHMAGTADGSSFLEQINEIASCATLQATCTEMGCCGNLVCDSKGMCQHPKDLPIEADWTERIPTAKQVINQGACGSCWAVSALGAIQMQASINEGFNDILSPQGIVECAPNAHECGGNGGCGGATAELAYAWVKSQRSSGGGLWTMKQDPYTAKATQCTHQREASFLQMRQQAAVNIHGWVRLDENKRAPVMSALVSAGPMVITMVASSLFQYSSGIIHECKDWTVNHAVLLMGYGGSKDDDTLHWKVRNSWGDRWGEKGFFRVKRHGLDEEEPCGTDTNPSVGVACKDAQGHYPKEQLVCGVCGILSDSSYPVGTHVLGRRE